MSETQPQQQTPKPEALNYEDWSGEMGLRWLENLRGFEGTIAPIGDTLIAHAALRPGERVLDIGFGGGATSLAAAQAVAPGGDVVGIDICPDLVSATTRRAAQAGVPNARFLCADAATAVLPDGPYDRLISRFGVMFFPDPVAAFTNLRGLLKPGGRMDLAVWGPPPENPWIFKSMMVARQHVDLPTPEPRAPGPFAFEERDYLHEILQSAGFTQIDIVADRGLLPVGGAGATPAVAQDFAQSGMAFGQIVREHPEPIQAAVRDGLMALYDQHHRPGEGVMMGYAIWLVSATA